jgi:hypothetical protein
MPVAEVREPPAPAAESDPSTIEVECTPPTFGLADSFASPKASHESHSAPGGHHASGCAACPKVWR